LIKNNVTRLLDSRHIPYTAYELPIEKLSTQEVAVLLYVPLDKVYKTIVVKRKGRGKPILALVPGGSEVNLKAVAQAVGEKKVILATEREAEDLTGLSAGGISPLALINRGFQILLDRSAQVHENIHISGGERGLNIRLPTEALLRLTNAQFADIGSV